MKRNVTREKLKRGEATTGVFIGLGSPAVAELLGEVGFDWLIIETEHSAIDVPQIEHMLMAMQSSPATPLVRVPSSDPISIQRALDTGAMGIIVPMVRSADEARAVVAATRYPPGGARSYGGLRSSRYTFDSQDYFREANENILTVLILETREAVEQLEEIMQIDGVDAIYMGTFDLCLSLGLNPMEQPHAIIEEIIDRTLELGKKHNVAVGSVYASPEQHKQNKRRGFRMLGYADYLLLAGAAREGLKALSD